MTKLKKVIIPVAGLGTRMLPATKAIPKEMLPIIDKPIIQIIVEEILAAGFEEIILITHSSKNSIENHFDTSFELENSLEKRVKRSLLKEVKSISALKTKITSIRQAEAKGLGHAIFQAKEIIKDEPFAVVLPDRVINQYQCNLKTDNLAKMKKYFESFGKNILLIERVSKKDVNKFGIVKLARERKIKDLNLIESIIEKPSIKNAPSNLAAVGRYILDPKIFNFISLKSKKNKEIELTDAINSMILSGEEVFGLELKGECFDCGSKIGYLEAIIKSAIHHNELGADFMKMLKNNKN